MREYEKINAYQFTLLVTLFIVGDALLYVPSWLATSARQDAWIGGLLGLAEALLLAWLHMWLAKRYFPSTLIEICRTSLGVWAGTAAAWLYVSFFVVDLSIILNEIGDFITTQMMPETPIEMIIMMFTLIIIITARQGGIAMVRSSESLFPWFVTLYLILILFISPQIKPQNVQPVFGEGVRPIIEGNLKFYGNMEECIILLMLFPFVRNPKQAAKAYAAGLVAGIIILVLFTAIALLVLGPEMISILAYPSYYIAQKISVATFFERIEAVMTFIWFITVFVKLSVCYYAASYGIAQIIKLPDYRTLTLPLGIISVVLALVFVPNRPYFDYFATRYWTPYTLTFGLFLPVLMLGATWLRQSFGRR